MVEQFVKSVSEPANTIYYAFAGKSTPWPNDPTPEAPLNSVNGTYYDMNRQAIFGKRIGADDVKYMIRRRMWQSGTVYSPYNPDTVDLENEPFYVVTEQNDTDSSTINYSVFKCLNNNANSPSTVKPLQSEVTPDDQYYRTSDGYEWKYMYTINSTDYNRFATANYIPVIENADVVANSVNGTIDAYRVDDGGTDYNSHAKGFVKAGSVAGNNEFISLAGGTNVTLTVSSTSGFTFEKVVLSTDDTIKGVIVLIDSDERKIQLGGLSGQFNVGDTITTVRGGSEVTATVTQVEYEINSLSSNTDFYKGCSIYIRSGRGAGQLRDIEEYIVTGDERRVLLNSPFLVSLDTTSQFEITPKVYVDGDGAGAQAIAIVNTALQNTIERIEVIERGYGYTYANVSIIANTGFIDFSDSAPIGGQVVQANNAIVTGLLSPKGGHGSDAPNELYSSRVGISVEFDEDEGGTIPTQNEYRQIGIMKNPLFANLELTITTTDESTTVQPTDFLDGETIISYSPTANTNSVVLTSYSYDFKRYQTATVDDVSIFADGTGIIARTYNAVTQEYDFLLSGILRYKEGVDTLYVKKGSAYSTFNLADADVIHASDTTFDAANSQTFATISAVEYTYTGADILVSGPDDTNKTFAFKDSTNDLPIEIEVYLNGTNETSSVTVDGTTIDFTGSGETINPLTDKLFVKIISTSETYSDIDITTGASGEVSNRVPTLRLRNIRGDFRSGDTILGLQSGVKAKVESIDRSNGTFDNRLTLTVENVSNASQQSPTFDLDEEVLQKTGDQIDPARGYVHSINRDESNNIVGITLTGYYGNFGVSDDPTNSEIVIEGQSSGTTAVVTGKVESDLTLGSAEILYLENIQPIERADTSTERLKLIIEF